MQCTSCNEWNRCWGKYGSMSSEEWKDKDYLCDGCYREHLKKELSRQQERNRVLEDTTRQLSSRLSALEKEQRRPEPSDPPRPPQNVEQHSSMAPEHSYARSKDTRKEQQQTKRIHKGLVSVLGDSMVKYDKVKDALNWCLPPGMFADAKGISGATIQQVRPWAVKQIDEMHRKPEYTLIHAGFNNWSQNETDGDILKQVDRTMDAINKVAGDSKCLWAGIIPAAKESRRTNRVYIMELNEKIKAKCIKRRWGYVDPADFMEIIMKTNRKERDAQKIYWIDGLHLDEGGAHIYARAVKAAIQQGNF